MSFGLDNPRRRGDDIQIRNALGLCTVKPVSAKGREWFQKNTGSVEPQFLAGDVETTLADSFAALNLQVVWNPYSDTSKMRQIVSDALISWRKKQLTSEGKTL